jgi:CubicO group peptidase (beta-lactamase class C family)
MKGLLALCLYLICIVTHAQSYSNKADPNIYDKIDEIFINANRDQQFSGVLLVAVNGKPIYYAARGFRDFSKHSALLKTDVFELASVSKQFTSMIIMMLREEHKLNFDDPVEKYIRIPYKGITIRMLLNHTSGLPDYQDIMDKHWDKTKIAGNDDAIAYLNQYAPPPLFSPGTAYTYSNTGYLVLASIAEKASGKDFIELCRARIFKPLGMKSTDIRTNEEKAQLKNLALGHIHVNPGNRHVRADSFPSSDYTIWLGNRKGPGRVSSTAEDLLKWDQALYTNRLIPTDALSQAFTPGRLSDGTQTSYGFGWMLYQNEKTGHLIFHTGDNPGYHTQIRRYIDKKVTIILLNNNDSPAMDSILDGIETLLFSK